MLAPGATLPQRPTPSTAVVRSVEWFVEPCWRGERLLVRTAAGRISLTDRSGDPVDERFAEAASLLERALRTNRALLDGVWTPMPIGGAVVSDGATLPPEVADEHFAHEEEPATGGETLPGFVAIDLLEVDGQRLHDVPYQERRRLLDSVLAPSPRVAIGPSVRMPFERWIAAWRAAGFTHYLAKHMNSRYVPGEVSAEWLKIPIAEPSGPSLLGRLFGTRRRPTVHIEDAGPAARNRASERG